MPVGAAVMILVLLCAKQTSVSNRYLRKSYLIAHLIATILQAAPLISLLLSLNWAGRKYSFRDPKVEVLFVLPAFSLALIGVFTWLYNKKRPFKLRYWISKRFMLSYIGLRVLFVAFLWAGFSVMGYYVSPHVPHTSLMSIHVGTNET
jgi:hypothetical protein